MDAFEQRVQRGGPAECWPWTGKEAHGYGRFRGRMATHVALERTGSFSTPERPYALHSCDNPPCVNPAHLRWGAPAENVREAEERGLARHPRGEAHGRAKLSSGAAAEIRALAASHTQVELAARFGVSQTTISRTLRGTRWIS